jgi:glutamate 5-kinase
MRGGKQYKRIVVKFGTSLLTGGKDRLDYNIMSQLVDQLSALHRTGKEITVVSSGAVACGRHKLGLPRKMKGIPYKQVLSSVGQTYLMYSYQQLFDRSGIAIAQALLTRGDLTDRAGYLNARNTLLALISWE